MAEMTNMTDSRKKRTRFAARLDMTPMVDLGFLLITFFVLTTSFIKPSAMDIALPAKDKRCGPPPTLSESRTLQLFLEDNNRVFYYNPLIASKAQVIDFQDSKSIRAVFTEVKSAIKTKWGTADTMVVIVKASNKSAYRNLVDVMDEIILGKINNYAIVDYKMPEDSLFLYAPK